MNAPIQQNLAVVQQENQMFNLVEKVLNSQNPDMALIEKMLDMQERVSAKQAEMAFNRDFAEMAHKIPVIAETSNIEYTDRSGATRATPYAALETIDAVIRPILSQYGFANSFRVEHPTQTSVTVTCIFLSKAGKKDQELNVLVKGGKLKVTYRSDNHVFLKGPATHVFDGVIEIPEEILNK